MRLYARHFALWLSVLGALWMVPVPSCQAIDADHLVEDLTKQVSTLSSLRDQMASTLPVKADGNHGCYQLTLYKALDGHDLIVQVIRRAGTFTEARAWSPSGSPLHFLADPSKLQLQDGQISGALLVRIMTGATYPDHHPELFAIKPSWFRVSIPIASKDIGSAEVTNPESAAATNGPLQAQARFIPLLKPSWRSFELDSDSHGFAAAAACYDEAMRIWQQLRAVEMAKRIGLPYKLCLQQIPLLAFTWPEPRRPSSVAKSAGNNKQQHKKNNKKNKGPKRKKLQVSSNAEDDDLFGDIDSELEEMNELALPEEVVTAAVEPMRDHLATYIAAARQALKRKDVPPVAIGNSPNPDPEFVAPACSELIDAKATVLKLPPTLGQAGPVRWVHPSSRQWIAIAPFAITPWDSSSPMLPTLIPDRRTTLKAHIAAIRHRWSCPYGPELIEPAHDADNTARWEGWATLPEGYTHHERPWEHMPVKPFSGRFWAPFSGKPNYTFAGWEYTSSYHVTEVDSPKQTQIWASVQATWAVSIWVNDQLVWRSDRYQNNPQKKPAFWLLQLPLKQGRNRIMLRSDHGDTLTHQAFRLCVAGGPRPADIAQQISHKRQQAYKEHANPHKQARQFRRDHSGSHPDAKAVLAWDIPAGHNVAWFKKLGASPGVATTVTGDLVVTTEEPDVVVALEQATGTVRWRTRVSPTEVYHPEIWDKVHADFSALDALSYDDPEIMAKRSTLIDKIVTHYPDKFRPMPAAKPKMGFTGDTMSTIIATDEALFVKIAANILARLNHQGEKQWIIDTGGRGGQMGYHANSPTFHDGDIICQLPAYGLNDMPTAPWDDLGGNRWERQKGRRAMLRRFDGKTGEVVWTAGRYYIPHWGNRYDADGIPTPHLVELSNGDERMTVIVTGGGQVWRAADGKRLLDNFGHQYNGAPVFPLGPGTFAVFSTLDYHKSGGYAAGIRLIMESKDEIRSETMWVSQQFRSTGLGGWILHQGALHGIESKNRGRMVRFDAKDGSYVSQTMGCFRNSPGHAYASPSLVGGIMYVACDGRIGWNKNKRWGIDQQRKAGQDIPYPDWLPGNCSTILPGKDPLILARNSLLPNEGITFGPDADQDRIYIRLRSGLLCLQENEAGRAYAARTVAETLLAQLPSCPLDQATVLQAKRRLTPQIVTSGHACFDNGRVLRDWFTVGPITNDKDGNGNNGKATAVAAQLTDGSRAWWKDKEYPKTIAGIELKDRLKDGGKGFVDGLTTEELRYGTIYDLAAAHEQRSNSQVFWVTTISLTRQQTLRWDCPHPGINCWIGGQAITHGARIQLGRGSYQLTLRSSWTGTGPQTFRPRLWDATDVKQERAFLASRLQRMAPYFATAKALGDNSLKQRITAAEQLLD